MEQPHMTDQTFGGHTFSFICLMIRLVHVTRVHVARLLIQFTLHCFIGERPPVMYIYQTDRRNVICTNAEDKQRGYTLKNPQLFPSELNKAMLTLYLSVCIWLSVSSTFSPCTPALVFSFFPVPEKCQHLFLGDPLCQTCSGTWNAWI